MTDKDFDDILISLGSGNWNYFHYFVITLIGLMIPSLILSGAFSAPKISHKCNRNLTEDAVTVDECIYMNSQNQTKTCTSWEYQSTFFKNSMTQEFNLICERTYLRPVFQTSYMFGNFIGAPINGFLADRFGRRKLIIIGMVVLMTTGLISTILSNIFLIITCRFIMGLCHAAVRTTGYILCLEICEPKHRSAAGVLISLPWAIGTVSYGILGYFIRDWRWLQRACLVPGMMAIIFIRYLSESPRWFIVNGKFKEAMEGLKHAAKKNNAMLPPEDDILERMERILKSSLSEERNADEADNIKKSNIKNAIHYVTILFRTPAIRRLTLLLYFMFFSTAFIFYGLSLSATNFGLNPYLYIIVGGLVQLPGYTILVPIIQKFGRIPPTTLFYLVCGVVIVVLSFVSNELKWLIILLAMTGKMFISAAFQAIYLIASETFPTEIRMQGIGTSQMVSRIGSIAAPYLLDLIDSTYIWALSAVFGFSSLIAGCVTGLIPETLNSHLPETIAIMELKFSQKKSQK